VLPRYPLSNIYGIEIEPFAVEIAKATLWMTHGLIARQFGAAEPALPLATLNNLVCADSLKTDWPEVDAIIGNPPFHGDRRLRAVVGDDYIDWLKNEFGVGVKDHCVYFFRKTHQQMKPGTRAGLVATNTISQAKNRDASLAWIAANGGTITDAVSTKPWSGDAAVHVSIVAWQKGGIPDGEFRLDGVPVEGITPSLTPGRAHREARKLEGNRGHAYQGFLLNGIGFVITPDEAETLLARTDAKYRDVVAPFLNGEDIVDRPNQDPSRWVIDFGRLTLEEAELFPAALSIVRERVKPFRDGVSRKAHRERWWQFAETRPGLVRALEGLDRYIVTSRVGKRLIMSWGLAGWRPSEACVVFPSSDEYLWGILQSRIHEVWVRANGSTLEDRMRYVVTSCFDTFPFPWPSPRQDQIDTIVQAAKEVASARHQACISSGRGLTRVYNAMDDGAYTDLKDAHRALDRAVAASYGWEPSIVEEPGKLLSILHDLNEEQSRDPGYQPFVN
jgi:hypothetical protein